MRNHRAVTPVTGLSVLIVLVLAAIACADMPMPPPTPTAAPAAQVSAAPSATAPLLPTFTPVVIAAQPQRVQFDPGAMGTTELGAITPGAPVIYLVGAQAGQSMNLKLTAKGGSAVALGVKTPGGALLLDAAAGQTAWTGMLPESGDYTLTVTLVTSAPTNFTLSVLIPPPNAQAPGECDVTAVQDSDAYFESSYKAERFGAASAGQTSMALARTADGWIGFDPGVAQAANVGRARLRWYAPGTQLTYAPAGCEFTLPMVLSLAVLENGTYAFGQEDVHLTNGSFTDPNFDATTPGHQIHDTFMGSARGFGDMNGDGSEDAAIVLATNTGGSGTFIEIVLVLNVNGAPQPVPGFPVGDREPVNALTIDGGILTADLTIRGPNDGLCCPSVHATWKLQLQNGQLVKIE